MNASKVVAWKSEITVIRARPVRFPRFSTATATRTALRPFSCRLPRMNAMQFEQQIQVCIGKTTGTPMLASHDIARLRFKFAADLATPRAVFEGTGGEF